MPGGEHLLVRRMDLMIYTEVLVLLCLLAQRKRAEIKGVQLIGEAFSFGGDSCKQRLHRKFGTICGTSC